MEKTSPIASAQSAGAKQFPSKRRRMFFGFCFGVILVETRRFLVGYEGPWAVRLALSVVPLVLLGFLAVFHKMFSHEDELEILISRKAMSFAFFAALLALVALDQLQAAKLVPAFAWTNNHLILLFGLLLSVGMLWSGRRYR